MKWRDEALGPTIVGHWRSIDASRQRRPTQPHYAARREYDFSSPPSRSRHSISSNSGTLSSGGLRGASTVLSMPKFGLDFGKFRPIKSFTLALGGDD